MFGWVRMCAFSPAFIYSAECWLESSECLVCRGGLPPSETAAFAEHLRGFRLIFTLHFKFFWWINFLFTRQNYAESQNEYTYLHLNLYRWVCSFNYSLIQLLASGIIRRAPAYNQCFSSKYICIFMLVTHISIHMILFIISKYQFTHRPFCKSKPVYCGRGDDKERPRDRATRARAVRFVFL